MNVTNNEKEVIDIKKKKKVQYCQIGTINQSLIRSVKDDQPIFSMAEKESNILST